MKTLSLEDVQFTEAINDTYSTCKYIERQGISLEDITLGNAHDMIEEIADDYQLPITQILQGNVIEGYLIGA